MIGKSTITRLLMGVLLLPTAMMLVVGAAQVLGAMGDAAGALGLHRVALGLALIWVFTGIALVVSLAVNAIADEHHREP